jgi:hypothetical protein
MIKYCVYDEKSEVSSPNYDTEEEAIRDLEHDISHIWSIDDAKVIEVDD